MRYRLLTFLLLLILPTLSTAQNHNDTSVHKRNIPTLIISSGKTQDPLKDYQPFSTKTNDLLHTRLQLKFDFDSCFLYGKAWITLCPHFYPVDSVLLDAKGMTIQKVALLQNHQKRSLAYTYDRLKLHISLPSSQLKGTSYTIFIKYIAKPNQYAASSPGGSASVTSDKGLFFINPHQRLSLKPTEVWSMGYPESNSVWFPTIDKPNQKTTEDITMTVPDTLTTFSNGRLISKTHHKDGTRSDHWVMTYPNAPYLFTIAAGSFSIIKDHYKTIPVRYFVEKNHAPYAKDIFGETPRMIAWFSKILQTPYPWKSYDQIVARDFITGAMENTTATMHGESLYKTKRQLQDDGYRNESVIAHELFHQWFGDLVTCKSWANITLNESFGDYGEMLWAEHKYGSDMAAQHNYKAMQRYFYFASTHQDHPLVYDDYPNKNQVLDAVSYQKGGRILNMLRHEVGDHAFFASLHEYLERNKFQSADASQLRLAFEKVTGRDLHLFWQQWYHRKGYPKLNIQYHYDSTKKIAKVQLQQTQEEPTFLLHFYIDVYENGKRHRHKVQMNQRHQTYTFSYHQKPDLINVDGEKMLLAERTDHKTLSNYIYQYNNAGNYLDRREAIMYADSVQDKDLRAQTLLLSALQDSFYGLRKLAIEQLHLQDQNIHKRAFPILKDLLNGDPHSSVRAAALVALTTAHPEQEKNLILKALQDSSLSVESTALSILNDISHTEAYHQAKRLQPQAEAPLTQSICKIYARQGHLADFAYVKEQLHQTGSFEKMGYLPAYLYMLGHTVTQSSTIHTELQQLIPFAKVVGPRYGYYIISLLNDFIDTKRNAAKQTVNKAFKEKLLQQAAYGQEIMKKLSEVLE